MGTSAKLDSAALDTASLDSAGGIVYEATGTCVIDYDGGTSDLHWRELSWVADTPEGTSVQARARAAETQAGLSSATWSDYVTVSGGAVDVWGRWVQVEWYLATTDVTQTPVVSAATVTGYEQVEGGQVAHADLSGIGTNTHAQVDTHIGATGTAVHGLGTAATAAATAFATATHTHGLAPLQVEAVVAAFRQGRYFTASNLKGLWIMDPPDGTAVLDRSGLGHDGVLNTDASGLTPGVSSNLAYSLTLGSGSPAAAMTVADHGDFSFGGGADSPFSVVVLANPSNVASKSLCAKYALNTGATAREWWAFWDANAKLNFAVYDESANAVRRRSFNTASSSGTLRSFVFTYDAVNSAGLKIYRDAVQVADTDTSSGSYTAMENTVAVVGTHTISAAGAVSGAFVGQYYLCAIIAQELSQAQVSGLDRLLRIGWAGLAA